MMAATSDGSISSNIELLQLTKRNYCFILNNWEFNDSPNLPGYKKDAANIEETFKKLDFIVQYEENKTGEEMVELFEGWSETDFSDRNNECVVIFILSHGDEHGEIYGTDNEPINIKLIEALFDECEMLRGKPKLIFLQACRGELTPVVSEYVSAGSSTQYIFRDTFVFYSTTEGFISLVGKDEDKGTHFITSICDNLQRYGNKLTLSKLVTKVNKVVSETKILYEGRVVAQAPEAVHTLCLDVILCNRSTSISVESDVMISSHMVKKRNPCILLTTTKCEHQQPVADCFSKYRHDIEKTFSNLNFNVEQMNDATINDIKSEFNNIQKSDYSGYDCFACMLLSCGGRRDEMEVIYGSEGKDTNLNSLIAFVSKNSSLLKMPKLFFVVVHECTKSKHKIKKEDSGQHTAAAHDSNKKKMARFANIFVYYVTVKDTSATELFLGEFCRLLNDSVRNNHLEEIIWKLNYLFSMNKQSTFIPEVRSSLTYNVFFNYVGAGSQPEEDGDITYTFTRTVSEDLNQIYQQQYIPDISAVNLNESAVNDEEHPTIDEDQSITSRSFQSINMPSENDSIDMTGDTSGNCDIITRVPTLDNLSHPHIMDLANALDPRSPIANWEQLGRLIFQGEMDLIDKVMNLRRLYYGGASPGEALLIYLMVDGITLKRFLEVVEKCRRKDILNLFKTISAESDEELDDVLSSNAGIHDKLKLRMEKVSKGIKNWRDMAYEFGCTDDQVNDFKLSNKDEITASPTEGLITLIRSTKVNYKLSEFKLKLHEIGRNDVAEKVDGIMKSISLGP